MQPRKPFVFLSFAGEDSAWVQNFRSVTGFEKTLQASEIYDYVASPEMVRSLDVVKDEVNRSDIFFAFLSRYYLPDQTDQKEVPLTLLEFETAVARFGSDSESRPLLVLVMLDKAGRRWWDEDRRHRDDLPEPLRRKAYLNAIDSTKDQPVDISSIWYDILRLAADVRTEWVRVAAEAPLPKLNGAPPILERDVILMGHPEVRSDPEVTDGLDQVARLLKEQGKAFRRWPDEWSAASAGNGEPSNGPAPAEVASLIELGSDFVRAVDATEASWGCIARRNRCAAGSFSSTGRGKFRGHDLRL
jgi:hypothetical protein